MSQTPAMTVVTRRALVRQLVDDDPTLSQRAIAAQLGVSKDTVRRDLEEMSRTQSQTAPVPAVAEPQAAPEATGQTPPVAPPGYLLLRLDEPLRQALAALRATVGAADTHEQNVKAARAAIRSVADTVIEEQQEGSRT
ncbi:MULTISPECIES: HTH domain-containing protein [unclassified Streptomyces]|uniref:HTH domain-containing protein n=1 Tax=unclassified Streptomyces TaxID=2593676 RepID=UPI0013E8A26C|nr:MULTISPECIES: HTH domain-containing protein [unclassified Streptomyces]